MLTKLQNMFSGPKKPNNSIIVVSGLPRSGTSLMQAMLQAGGIEPLTDGLRTADENNPKGYYEFERVKALKDGDTAWLEQATGKSVKIISALLSYLPSQYEYCILFMRRNIDEILASQKAMLVDRKEATNKVSDEELTRIFQKHLENTERWLGEQGNMRVLTISYNQLLEDPGPDLARIDQFLDGKLQVDAMAKVIDQNLYRRRKSSK